MKLAKISLAIITSLALMALICPAVQASEESGDVDLSGTVPLTISDVSASSIGYYGVTISWKTNGDATSQVFYDTEFHDNIADYADNTIEETTPVTEHSVRLTGLSSGRTYHYRVRSAAVIDGNDFIAISEDYTFRTSSPAAPSPAAPPAPPAGTTDVRGMVTTAGVFLESVTATSDDELCTLTIPEGTVGLTEELEPIDEITMVIMDEPPDPPEEAHIIGLTYDFGPDRATFEPPITLTFSYDPSDLPEGIAEEDLVLAYYDEDTGKWVELDCVVDTVNNTITASVPHFTTFAIIGVVPVVAPPALAPARFTVSSLEISPSELAPSEEVTITVLVANTGGKSGSYQITLVINDLVEATKEVTVRAGLSKEVTFSVTKDEADTYAVTVDGLSSSFTVVAPEPVVVPPAPAAFSVSGLAVEPTGVEPGETVTVSIVIANTGGKSGSYNIALKIDGVKEAEERVTIAAGESQDVSFSVTKEEVGTYTVAVDGLIGSFTVVSVVEPPVEPPGINWPLIGGIIAAAVIVVGLFYYFLVFRRRAYQP